MNTVDFGRVMRQQILASRIMDELGDLLYGWDGLANDTKADIRESSPLLFDSLEKIARIADDPLCSEEPGT